MERQKEIIIMADDYLVIDLIKLFWYLVHIEREKEISIRADDYFSYRPYKAFLVPGSCRATERNKYKG
jgi:hypothetical protein